MLQILAPLKRAYSRDPYRGVYLSRSTLRWRVSLGNTILEGAGDLVSRL